MALPGQSWPSQPYVPPPITSTMTNKRSRINGLAAPDHLSLNVEALSPHTHDMLDHASIQLLSQQRNIIKFHDGNTFSAPISANGSAPLGEHGKIMAHNERSSSHYHGRYRSRKNAPTEQITKPGKSFVGHQKTFPSRNTTNPAGPGYSYSHAPRTRFGNQQSDPYRRIQIQVNYLDSLAARVPTLGSLGNELQTKENLRVVLTKVAREALEQYAEKQGITIGPKVIDLKCFGSLRNGFTLPGADLDLVMTTHAGTLPRELELECPWILSKAFLNAGFGSFVISKTRVPIIKLCEKPSRRLLDALKVESEEAEIKKSQETSETNGSPESNATLPCSSDVRRPSKRPAKLNFPESGVGIQCDINFSERLALYNTELLRCYALCDERVRLVGVFVKMWAKARKINSSYRGTMCSYGYILMVIHYLMNVAHPPLIPNLQTMYRSSSPPEATIVNGHDVHFFNNEDDLKANCWSNGESANRQTVGELLRGFFAYYGSRGRNAPLGGFDWVRDVISIRTQGGIISKSEKGWTAASADDSGSRLRFLIAIEDPFEHGHNVGRTVTQRGLKTIRSEFYRAQAIINRIQEIPGAGWEWRCDNGDIGQDFLAEARDLSGSNDLASNHSKASDPHNLTSIQPEKGEVESHGTSMPPNVHNKPVVPDLASHMQSHYSRLECAAQSFDNLNLDSTANQPEIGRNGVNPNLGPASKLAVSPRQQGLEELRLDFHRLDLDSRQFYGPNSIRDRNSAFRPQ